MQVEFKVMKIRFRQIMNDMKLLFSSTVGIPDIRISYVSWCRFPATLLFSLIYSRLFQTSLFLWKSYGLASRICHTSRIYVGPQEDQLKNSCHLSPREKNKEKIGGLKEEKQLGEKRALGSRPLQTHKCEKKNTREK